MVLWNILCKLIYRRQRCLAGQLSPQLREVMDRPIFTENW